MNSLPSLSIFFPSLNDSKVLPKILSEAYRIGRKITKRLEIIVIDDGSTDGTPGVLARLKKTIPVLRTIRHRSTLGYGGALRSGFNTSTAEFVFYTDGDGQYDVNDLPILVDHMNKDVDVINGIKQKRIDPWYRVFLGSVYASAMRIIFRLPIQDVDCDFRLIRGGVLRKIHLKSNGGAICVELVKRLERGGARFAEVEVHHRKRLYGRSHFYTVHNILRLIQELSALRLEFFISRV